MRTLVLLAAVAGVLSAQRGDTFTATITGNRGDRGKCTIEVEVDGVADVEVSGDTGRLRTLSGDRAIWRRMQCSEPLPRNPADFRFRGIDGRGRVELVRSPGDNRGVAVIRIEDKKGGREGYTFDLEWSGGSTYDTRNNRRESRGRGGYTVTCEARGNRRQYCTADTTGGVRMARGNDACREGDTWGYDRRGIWVDRGCRAEFQLGQ